jgi:putative transcriptional regulator
MTKMEGAEMVRIIKTDNGQELIFDYAAGALDEARQFMVDAHRRMNEQCKADIGLCEDIGGYLLVKDCHATAMKPSARDKMRALLDDVMDESGAHQKSMRSVSESQCAATVEMLKSYGLRGELIDHLERSCRMGCEQSKWSKLTDAVHFVNIDSGCSKSIMRLVRVDAGTQIPEHSHRSEEITLVLKGAMEDDFGRYNAGDLIVRQKGDMHAPRIGDAEDLLCLTLTYKPVRMRCVVRRTINIFFRF